MTTTKFDDQYISTDSCTGSPAVMTLDEARKMFRDLDWDEVQGEEGEYERKMTDDELDDHIDESGIVPLAQFIGDCDPAWDADRITDHILNYAGGCEYDHDELLVYVTACMAH